MEFASLFRVRFFAVAALVFTGSTQAEIVSNLGTLTVGRAEFVACTTSSCIASSGTVGGSLPANTAGPDPFQHQIIFKVPLPDTTISSNQVLDSTSIDTANMSLSLYLFTSGSTTVGGTATGILLATATKSTFGTTTNFEMLSGALDPINTYFLEILGAGAGVIKNNASYAQQIAQFNPGGPGPGPSPVPLPAPFLLLALALSGLGITGWRRKHRRVLRAA